MREDTVVHLTDNAARLPAALKAQVAEFTPEEQAKLHSGRLGKYAQVIGRNTPIEVIRGELPGAPREMVAPLPTRATAPTVTNPLRQDAMDTLMAQRGVITVGAPAAAERLARPPTPSNAVVIPYSDAQLRKAGKAVPPPAAPAPPGAPSAPASLTVLAPVGMTTATVVPSAPVAPLTEVAVPTAQGLTVPMPSAAPGGVVAFKRETVILSSPTIGKHRLKVAQVLVSDTVVVLAYEDDEDATIYEPPAAGPEHEITVEYGTVKYICAYLGQSFSQPVLGQPGRQLLLVVLVRI